MKLSDICIITENVPALTRFYENILKIKADINKVNTSFVIGDEGIAIYSKKLLKKICNLISQSIGVLVILQ